MIIATFQPHPIVHSRVVDQSVNKPELFQHNLDGIFTFLRTSQFCNYLETFGSKHAYLFQYAQIIFFVPPHNHRNSTLGSKRRDNRPANPFGSPGHRSEEHTPELQSLMRISYAVFCLKKKNTTNHRT